MLAKRHPPDQVIAKLAGAVQCSQSEYYPQRRSAYSMAPILVNPLIQVGVNLARTLHGPIRSPVAYRHRHQIVKVKRDKTKKSIKLATVATDAP